MYDKINKNNWLSYLKTYEDFNKNIPDVLKKLFKDIKDIIGTQTDSFEKSINLNDLNFCDIIINIKVNFNKLNNNKPYHKKDIIYYSNININDLIENKDIIDIPINISDVNINMNKLISVISHEIRHIYDVYTINDESDMESFIRTLYYNKLSKSENNNDFKYFLHLVYLSLEHELIARNTMIYEMFIECNCSKEELIKLFEDSYIYESFIKLNDFNYTNLINIPNIIEKVNDFINYFGGNICQNNDDVILFFTNWKEYFKNKSDEYIIESYKIIDNVFNMIKENKIVKKQNVKELLLYIHNKYIIKKDI
ncbi:hypothetical protein M0Q50_07305 [bacterium]|jgi:hypothetical protein|nr:hypothetical protein [bacterium]